jgi:hypothetical protein
MLSRILARESYCSSGGMIPPRHTLSLLSLTETSTKYSRRLRKYFRVTRARESIAANDGAVSQRCVNRFETGPLPSGDEQYRSNSKLVLTGQCMFLKRQCLEPRWRFITRRESILCKTMRAHGNVHFQEPISHRPTGSASKAIP